MCSIFCFPDSLFLKHAARVVLEVRMVVAAWVMLNAVMRVAIEVRVMLEQGCLGWPSVA